MTTPEKKPEAQAVGKRLRQFRFGLAIFLEDPRLKTLGTFAGLTNVHQDNLSNWELGRSNAPYWYTQRLKEKYGVSYLFEWIYGGDASGLPGRLRDTIEINGSISRSTETAFWKRKKA